MKSVSADGLFHVREAALSEVATVIPAGAKWVYPSVMSPKSLLALRLKVSV